MHSIADTLHEALHSGGRVLSYYYGNLESVEKKSEIDLVTRADKESEKAILSLIRERFPDHGILAEESGKVGDFADGDYRWIVDPLDGTTNFAHSLPVFAVSIGVEYRGEMVFGGVYNPVSRELFFAEKGSGAFLNGTRISVSPTSDFSEALLVSGFPYDRRERIDHYLDRWKSMMLKCQGVVRLGSAALDLSFVACGRLDGFWEEFLHPWDTAAGMLLVQEAGGVVTDFSGGAFRVEQEQILASNGRIHEDFRRTLGSGAN